MLRTRVMAGQIAGVVLALVLASALVALYSVELLVPRFRVHAGHPAPVTLRLPITTEVLARPVQPGVVDYFWHTTRLVVSRGQVPEGATGQLVDAYESYRRPFDLHSAVGLWSIYLLTAAMLFTYMRRFGPNRGKLLRTHIGIFTIVFALGLVAKAVLLFTPLSEYYIPAAALPLWVALYIDRRAAFLVNLVLAFLIASFVGFDVTLIAVFLARGMASALFFRDKKHPRSMVIAGLIGGVAGALMLIACRYFLMRGFDIGADLRMGLQGSLFACIAGGTIAGLLGWSMQEPVGLAMGAVSRAQLIDLCDLDQPLLKKMAAEAPGSWQHARAMANLAEDAAAAIHADAMLTRAGAYYHDLGKTLQSQYFVENLAPGERSPHEDLEPDVSADVIMAHVVGGTKILREAGVPEPVIEFAYTHHGTSVIEYFWHKCLQQGNPKGLSDTAFRYPGMKPQTRETAILMLIDSIEAASRTIDPPDRDKFEEMIQRVIFTKMKQAQLDESGLSIDDLRVLVTSIADTLVKVYHHRIKYPWQRAVRSVPAEPETPVPPQPAIEALAEAQSAEANEPAIATQAASEPPAEPRATEREDGDEEHARADTEPTR